MLSLPKPTRRQILTSLAACAVAPAVTRLSFAAPAGSVSRETVESLIRPLFQTSDRALFELAIEAYQRCILGNLRFPATPFRFTWLTGGGGYVGQWLWDTTFVTDLLAVLPGQRDILR